jgi:hypothetical protein
MRFPCSEYASVPAYFSALISYSHNFLAILAPLNTRRKRLKLSTNMEKKEARNVAGQKVQKFDRKGFY